MKDSPWARILLLCLLLAGPAGAVNYPVKVSGQNPHVLVDQSGVPFLLQGDCAWALMVTLDHEGVEKYLENRRQKGFNTVVVMLVANHGSINGGFSENVYGVAPFNIPGDFSTPNESYFTNCDWVIERAAAKGIQVVLAPCYVGYDAAQGWQDEMVANGLVKCRAYGRFVGERYKNRPNLIWLHSGDNGDTNYFPLIKEIAAGVAERDPNHLATAKLFPEQSARDFFDGEDWLTLNTTYAYGINGFFDRRVYAKTIEDYNVAPALASFLVESTFENEHGADAYWVRRQAYWSVLGGSSGQVMGNRDIWPFYTGWETQIDGDASVSMSHLKWLFDRRPWYAMAPDTNVVTSGSGTFEADDYLTALRHTNGHCVIAYAPTKRNFTVDLGRLSGAQVHAWWFNPRTGRATFSGIFPASGSRVFSPPDFNDWVLVLEDAARRFTSLDPFLPGKFNGLFAEEDNVQQGSAGFISASMTSRGTYSGSLRMGRRLFSFRGKLTRDGLGTNVIKRAGTNALTVELQFTRGEDGSPRQLLGRVTDGNWIAPLRGEQAVFSARTNRAPMTGRYTMTIAGHEDSAAVPAGCGYGTVIVSSGGTAGFRLTLADGSKLLRSVTVSGTGLAAFYGSLQRGRGSLMGWLAFTNRDLDDIHGSLNWIKAADESSKFYAGGFNTNFTAIGSAYLAPSGSTNRVLMLTNASIQFSGGNIDPAFSNLVRLISSSTITNLGRNPLALTFSPVSGIFQGSATDPADGSLRSFSGAVFQKLNAGQGFSLGTNQSGRVVLGP